MNDSMFMAQRFALDLHGLALGLLETTRMISVRKTKEAKEKIEWLNKRLDSLRMRPFLSDSLRTYLNEEFKPEKFYKILNDLKSDGDTEKIIPEIMKLIEETRGYIHESKRAETGIQRAF